MGRISEWEAWAVSAVQTTHPLKVPEHLWLSILCLDPFGTCPGICADPQIMTSDSGLI